MALSLKAIMPKSLNKQRLLDFAESAVEDIIEDAESEFLSTTKDFENTVVEFRVKFSRRSDRVSGEVSTDNEIYGYLNFGTSVRYAVMTPDFVSKTRKGVIPSRRGRGGFSHLSPIPRDGIEAREFDKQIANKLRKRFFRYGEQALRQAVRASGHKV